MEEIKVLLPFNILERGLLEDYLNESLQQGKYLTKIQPVAQGINGQSIEIEEFYEGDYEASFELISTEMIYSYEVLFFQPNDGVESTKKRKQEETSKWIEEKESQGKRYQGKWQSYYIFACLVQDTVDTVAPLNPIVTEEEKQYLKKYYYVPNIRRSFLSGMLLIVVEITKWISNGWQLLVISNLALLMGTVGAMYVIKSMYSLREWNRFKKRRQEKIMRFNQKLLAQINKKKKIEETIKKYMMILLFVSMSIDIVYQADFTWTVIYLVITLMGGIFYLIPKEYDLKAKFLNSKRKNVLVIGMFLSWWMVVMITIFSMSREQIYCTDTISMAKEKYQDWPVILLQEETITDPTKETLSIEIAANYNQTLFGKYYELNEDKEYRHLENESVHTNESIRNEVYKYHFKSVANSLWKKIIEDTYDELIPIEQKQLEAYGVNEGWMSERQRKIYLKKDKTIIEIRGSREVIQAIQHNGQLKECIKKLS